MKMCISPLNKLCRNIIDVGDMLHNIVLQLNMAEKKVVFLDVLMGNNCVITSHV